MPAVDFAVLDQPAISMNSFYPRKGWTATPAGAEDISIPVADGIMVSGRFFPAGTAQPTILFFYGNGETAPDYDNIAPLYNQIGVNFLVADYRGYGRSDGFPSFTAMLADSAKVLDYASSLLEERDYTGPMFVMGRSMGRHAAFELSANCGDRLLGVIIESGRPILGNFTYGLESDTNPSPGGRISRQSSLHHHPGLGHTRRVGPTGPGRAGHCHVRELSVTQQTPAHHSRRRPQRPPLPGKAGILRRHQGVRFGMSRIRYPNELGVSSGGL